VVGPVVLRLSPGPFPRGHHGCGVLRLGAP
jgi:hypothetical protein